MNKSALTINFLYAQGLHRHFLQHGNSVAFFNRAEHSGHFSNSGISGGASAILSVNIQNVNKYINRQNTLENMTRISF